MSDMFEQRKNPSDSTSLNNLNNNIDLSVIHGEINNVAADQKNTETLSQSAKNDEADIFNNIGTFYYYGTHGMKQSFEKAIKYFKMAEERGSLEAKFNLGAVYIELAEPAIPEKSLEYFKSLSECNYPAAQYILADIYITEKNFTNEQNREIFLLSAVELLEASAAQNYPASVYKLGELYKNGIGVEANPYKGASLTKKAANLGDPCAQYDLGLDFYESENYDNAYYWWIKSAEQGHHGAEVNLGLMYANGEGVPQDYKEAMKWYLRAAKYDDPFAQFAIAVMYQEGQGITQDYNEALKWYKKSASLGYAEAQHNLGLIYEKGEIVQQDYDEAMKWYTEAAEQGDLESLNNLGEMYYSGKTGTPDYKMAFKCFRAAAEQGDVTSQFNLGQLYFFGIGTYQNYHEAFKWLHRAAQKKMELAIDFLIEYREVFEEKILPKKE